MYENKGGLIFKMQTAYDCRNMLKSQREDLFHFATGGVSWVVKKIATRNKPTMLDLATKYISDVEYVLLAYNMSENLSEDFAIILCSLLSIKNKITGMCVFLVKKRPEKRAVFSYSIFKISLTCATASA